MPVLVSCIATVHDWKALQDLHTDALLAQARLLRAGHHRVYRNVRNAAEVLIVVELSGQEDAQEMAQHLCLQLQAGLAARITSVALWEDMAWASVDPKGTPHP